MKRMILFNFLFALAFGFIAACSSNNGEENGSGGLNSENIKLSQTEITFPKEGGKAIITLTTNHEWAANSSQS